MIFNFLSQKLTVKITMKNAPFLSLTRGISRSCIAAAAPATCRPKVQPCRPRAKPAYDPSAVQRSTLLNGIQVASAKYWTQMAACTVMFQAGSRYECGDSLGATHFIRACSDAGGHGYTAFAKMRYLHQNGGYITCASDRQSISFTLRCPPTLFADLKYYLLDTAARATFNHWDLDDRRAVIKADLARITSEQRVLDLIQKASFTGPLANSVFCEEERIDGMSTQDLRCYTFKNFRTDRCTVGSVGVSFEETLKLAEKIEYRRDLPRKIPENVPSCFRAGFEFCDLGPGSDTWIALALPSCGGTKDLCGLLRHSIIAAACGSQRMQQGQHRLDRALQPPLGLMAGCDVFTTYRAFNIAYEDCGLFGILAKTRACSAHQVALAAAEFLRHVGDLDFKQIGVGKERVKLGLALQDEDSVLGSEDLALQLASGHLVDSAACALALVDAVCPDEVCATAKELSAKGKYMSMAVVGDVGAVPHDRELNN